MGFINVPYDKNNIQVFYDNNTISILSFAIVKNKQEMKKIIDIISRAAFNDDIFFARSHGSLVLEWKAAKVLNALKLQKSKFKTFNIGKRNNIFKEIGNFFLSMFYWK